MADLIRFRNQLCEKQASKTRKLSAKTGNYVMRDLEAVFEYAMKSRLASWNPASSVDRLKVGSDEHRGVGHRRRNDNVVSEDEVLSPAECRRLLDAATEGFDRSFLMTAAMTGARHDELLALRWSDVDLEARTIHFRRSLSWAKLPGQPTRAQFFDTKTGKKGNRKVPCPAELRSVLLRWRLQCPKGELDLVFPTPAGLPWHRSNVPATRPATYSRARGSSEDRPSHAAPHVLLHPARPGHAADRGAEVQRPRAPLNAARHLLALHSQRADELPGEARSEGAGLEGATFPATATCRSHGGGGLGESPSEGRVSADERNGVVARREPGDLRIVLGPAASSK